METQQEVQGSEERERESSLSDEILAMLVELPATVPDFDRYLAEETMELGVCPSSLSDEILTMLVELPASVPDFDRDLVGAIELGVGSSSLRRDLGDARRVAGDGAGP